VGMDLTIAATIMNTAGELLGQHWIALAVIGSAALIKVALSLTHLTKYFPKISEVTD